MRWSIIRLIWLRELRDQLRDRRTLFMIAGLPLLLYPVLGFAVLQFAVGFVEQYCCWFRLAYCMLLNNNGVKVNMWFFQVVFYVINFFVL